MSSNDPVAKAIAGAFGHISTSSIMDAVESIAKSNRRIADAITPNLIGTCPTGEGHVESLTEAVMGLTKSMMMIADAINNVASAIEDRK